MDFFLDSGAFSAYTKGVEIDIKEYCNFIKEHQDIIMHYAVLDVIGSAEETLKNQKIMEAEGLSPVPCFHYGEDYSYLTYYVDNYDYIALGGMVPVHTNDLIPWLDTVFGDYICTDKGYPKTKVHGFGLTTVSLMIRYPWHSVDSTSWKLSAGFGSIFIPTRKQNKYDYINGKTISISTEGTNNFELLTTHEQNYILEYLKYINIPFGTKDIQGVSNWYVYRRYANLLFFTQLEKQINKQTIKFINKRKGFF